MDWIICVFSEVAYHVINNEMIVAMMFMCIVRVTKIRGVKFSGKWHEKSD